MALQEHIEHLIQSEDFQKLSENLQSLLKNKNLNASQLAHILGIPMMTIRRLLSGETTDPRVSTLKMIADYFNVSIDYLISGSSQSVPVSQNNMKPHFVPKLDWDVIEKASSIGDLDLTRWQEWQSISLKENDSISPNTFALESRPSMFPRFPSGTIFIIDPAINPKDGDIVLIKLRTNNELTLRDLVIDPPVWHLHPIVIGSPAISYLKEEHEIIGVILLTLFFNRKKYN
jgi:transcriptional regulator with XRE-family HTH domain